MLMDRWPVVQMRSSREEGDVSFVCLVSRPRAEGAIAPAQVVAFDSLSMEPIGYFTWDIAVDGEALHVEVVPLRRRRGVATRMLNVAREISFVRGWPEPMLSDKRTPDGEAWARSVGAGPSHGPWTTCQACGEDGGERGITENHEPTGTLWLCDACSCGWLERGQDRVDRYLDALYLGAREGINLRERIIEADERISLDDRATRVEDLVDRDAPWAARSRIVTTPTA